MSAFLNKVVQSSGAGSPFAIPAYRRLFAAHTTSLIGSGVSTVALALLAIQIAPQGASVVLGLALAVKMLMYVSIAPFAGMVAARVPAKTALVTLDVVRAGVVAAMPWIQTEAQIYLAIALLSSASALFTPIYQGLLPSVVKAEDAYVRALSWAQIAFSLERIVSPLLAALLLLFLSFGNLFWLNAVTFLVSAALILQLPVGVLERSGDAQRPWWGISAYLHTPRLRAVLLAYVGIATASALVVVNTAVYLVQHLGHTPAVLSLTLAASGFGAICGAAAGASGYLAPAVAAGGR